MPRNILDQNWFDFFNKNGLQWQEGSLFGKDFTADQVGNLYGTAGNIIGTAGDVVNDVSNQYYAQNAGRADLANTVSGNSWGDVFSNSDKLSQGLQTISALQKDYSGVKNNDNLLNTWNSNDLQDEVHDSVEVGGVIGSTLSDTGKLAAAGSMFGPVGTFVGGVTGLLSGLGRGLFSAFQHNDAEEELNNAIKRANRAQVNNFYTTAKNNQQRQQRQAMMNYFDNGGSLDELNGVTKFNVGGSHSENPYEGIQQGIASDGNPNLVEEGEIKYKDYIYSARLKPSKSLLKEFNLPDKYAGKTFAEVADILQKESEDRPNDPISLQTLDDWMSRLAGAQEEYKAKAEQRRLAKAIDSMSDEEKAAIMSSLVQPMAQQEGIDLGQPMYASGGKIHIAKNKRGTFTAAAKKHGKSVQAFASQVLANKENYSPAMVRKANFARNSAKWHADGGHLFPDGGYPWQVGYLYDNGILKQDRPITSIPLVPYQTRVLYDPLLERNSGKELPDIDITAKKTEVPVEQIPAMVQPEFKPEFAELSNDPSVLDAAIEAAAEKKSNGTKNINFNPEYLRYAPVLGSAEAMLRSALQPKDFTVGNEYRQLSSQLRPIAAPHIGGYRRYNPYDVNLGDVENLALLASTIDANRGQNRATQGALNAAVINAAQKTAAARNLAAQQANEANRLAVDTYDLGIDQFNAQRDTQYDQLNQQILQNKLNMLMSAAQADDASKEAWANMYNTTRENFFNQLGNVGKDTWNRNQRDWLLNALGREGLLELLKAGYKIS